MSRHRLVRASVVLTLVQALFVIGALPAIAAVIGPPAQEPTPLTRIETTTDLNCAVNHADDTVGSFFGDTACGTLLATGGELFGPAVIPAGGAATPRTGFTPVSQTGVTGTGTAAEPWKIVTVVDLGASGLRITQTDSYINGQESYRTDVDVSNAGVDAVSAVLYRAGDCFLEDDDTGLGSRDTATGAVACTSATSDRIIQWLPISGGSSNMEGLFSSVWAAVGSQAPFPNTCECTSDVDNGAGLSWSISVPALGSLRRSHITTFSPAGVQPLTTTKTADSSTAEAGSVDGYTISISNPNVGDVALDSIFDTLPAGFAYVPGSTTGLTESDPTIDGQTLTWSAPGSVPGGGSAGIHFQVTVSSSPGTYSNNAGANAEGFTVAPTGPTAPITVTAAEEADLSITKTDDAPFGPDPVSSGGRVAYRVSVSNVGTAAATEVQVVDSATGGQVVRAIGTGWTCSIESNTATCDLAGSLAPDATAPDLIVEVQAPTTSADGTISDTATASAQNDPTGSTANQTTTVQGTSNPASRDQAQAFYDGTQTVTVETTRDTVGGFYSRIVVPPRLSPGVLSINERPAAEFPNFCGGARCFKQVQISVLPAGRTTAANPIHVFFFFPPPGDDRGEGKLYVKGDNETVASVVPKCVNKGVANPAKCLTAKKKLPNGDFRWEMLWRDGGDPIGAKRR